MNSRGARRRPRTGRLDDVAGGPGAASASHAAEQTFDRVAPHRQRWCGARLPGKDSRRW
ncbi:hypothetical protein [Amycolatopsis plumensis]|uniref:hypothetical protein n=1 Tax=Amycolatopsis plumensis TaxID=236508 RepID=UPI00360E18F5